MGGRGEGGEVDINWISVSSSHIRAVAWTPEDGSRLHCRFVNGQGGYYEGVPRSLFDDMLAAPSKGSFRYHNVQKAGYRWVPDY